MSTQTETDIAALVGEIEAPACEHSQHGAAPVHDDGPATHYVKSEHVCAGSNLGVYPACAKFVSVILAGGKGYCQECGTTGTLAEFLTILGPVNA